MAGLNKRLLASTLIEVVVSMTLILLVFSAVISILAQGYSTDRYLQRTMAMTIAQKYLDQTEKEQSYISDTKEVSGFFLRKRIDPINIEEPRLILVLIDVYTPQKEFLISIRKYVARRSN